MSLDRLTGPKVAKLGAGPSASRTRRPAVGSGAAQLAPPLRSVLAAIRDDLGFETATLFVPGAGTWKLLAREGPVRRWHTVLDPGAFEGTADAAEYPDARAIPGTGPRLAALGCASVATLPLPDGGRVLLDSSVPCGVDGWIERSRPYLELISIMSGPAWPVAGALRSHEEVGALTRLIEVCRDTLEDSESSPEDLVALGRDALRADEIFLVLDRPGQAEVLGVPVEGRPRRLPKETRTQILHRPGPGLPQAVVRKLAAWVGATSRTLAGAVGRDGEETDVLLVGWAEGPPMSPASLTVAARAMSMAAAALRSREETVASLVREERSRIAYALHDGLTQSVTGAVLELEALGQRIERDPVEAIAVLEGCKAEIRQALSELREVLFELSSDEEQPAPEERLTNSISDVLRRWRLPARVAVRGDLSGVPRRVLSVAYVVIREALTNVAKHAATSNVTVTLTAEDDELTVIVGDGGKGFSPRDIRAAREAKHVGLDMLKRRVAEIGGRLQVESGAGKGTRVIAALPIGGSRP